MKNGVSLVLSTSPSRRRSCKKTNKEENRKDGDADFRKIVRLIMKRPSTMRARRQTKDTLSFKLYSHSPVFVERQCYFLFLLRLSLLSRSCSLDCDEALGILRQRETVIAQLASFSIPFPLVTFFFFKLFFFHFSPSLIRRVLIDDARHFSIFQVFR